MEHRAVPTTPKPEAIVWMYLLGKKNLWVSFMTPGDVGTTHCDENSLSWIYVLGICVCNISKNAILTPFIRSFLLTSTKSINKNQLTIINDLVM